VHRAERKSELDNLKPQSLYLCFLATTRTSSIVGVWRKVRRVKHLVEPILSALWTLVPTQRKFTVFGSGGRKRRRTKKLAVHRNSLRLPLVNYCQLLNSLNNITIADRGSAAVRNPQVELRLCHSSFPANLCLSDDGLDLLMVEGPKWGFAASSNASIVTSTCAPDLSLDRSPQASLTFE
jgi:hypothetical protein